jgi:hypothetical protein
MAGTPLALPPSARQPIAPLPVHPPPRVGRAELRAQHRRLLPNVLRYTAVAASVALVIGVGYHYLRLDEPVNLAEQDTYQNPVLAQQEAERALNLLAANLNKGMGHLEKAKALSDKAENTLNKQLKVLK